MAAKIVARDRELIRACFEVDVDRVVAQLRDGANVNALFGKVEDRELRLLDSWSTASGSVGQDKWTPLMALASAPDYPPLDPKVDRAVLEDPERVASLKAQVASSVLEQRQADAIAILRLLLSHNPTIDKHDGYGATALHMAVDQEKPDMVRTLLKYGADPNTKCGVYIDGPSDITPLHVACNSHDIFDMLLEHGADVSARDSEGRTPLDWANLAGQFTAVISEHSIITSSGTTGPNWSDITGKIRVHSK